MLRGRGCDRCAAHRGDLGRHARRDGAAEGVPVLPVAGGLQPRAAVGYMTVAALEAAAACGAAPSCTPRSTSPRSGSSSSSSPGGRGRRGLRGRRRSRARWRQIPVIVGAGLTAPLAYRWKTQINENAKQHAFAGVLPEVDHNELVGWSSAQRLGRFSAVFLEDSDVTPRVSRRIALTRELIAGQAAATTSSARAARRRRARVLARAAR